MEPGLLNYLNTITSRKCVCLAVSPTVAEIFEDFRKSGPD